MPGHEESDVGELTPSLGYRTGSFVYTTDQGHHYAVRIGRRFGESSAGLRTI
jgi:hypothetical protein